MSVFVLSKRRKGARPLPRRPERRCCQTASPPAPACRCRPGPCAAAIATLKPIGSQCCMCRGICRNASHRNSMPHNQMKHPAVVVHRIFLSKRQKTKIITGNVQATGTARRKERAGNRTGKRRKGKAHRWSWERRAGRARNSRQGFPINRGKDRRKGRKQRQKSGALLLVGEGGQRVARARQILNRLCSIVNRELQIVNKNEAHRWSWEKAGRE